MSFHTKGPKRRVPLLPQRCHGDRSPWTRGRGREGGRPSPSPGPAPGRIRLGRDDRKAGVVVGGTSVAGVWATRMAPAAGAWPTATVAAWKACGTWDLRCQAIRYG